MIAVIIISAVLALVVWYLISLQFYEVAIAKGFSQKKYLWLTFVLGVVGVLLIIALPDRGNVSIPQNDELPDL